MPYVHHTKDQCINTCMWYMRIAKNVNTSMCVSTIYVKIIAKLCVAPSQSQAQTEFHPRFFPFPCCIKLGYSFDQIQFPDLFIHNLMLSSFSVFNSRRTLPLFLHDSATMVVEGLIRISAQVCFLVGSWFYRKW